MAIIKELHPATHKCQIVNADADEISFSFQKPETKERKIQNRIFNRKLSFFFVWSFNEGVARVIKVMLQSARNKNSDNNKN